MDKREMFLVTISPPLPVWIEEDHGYKNLETLIMEPDSPEALDNVGKEHVFVDIYSFVNEPVRSVRDLNKITVGSLHNSFDEAKRFCCTEDSS